MPKVALYCRLSVEDGHGEESESIRNQRILLTAYAKRQGWEIYDIYEDEDYSGLREDRPSFCRLIADARAQQFQIILCKTQSRFSRSAITAERYLHEYFPRWGIRFVTVVDGVDTAQRSNKKARQINSLVNEWYSEELSENIRQVFRRKMELGQFLGNYAPFGYEKDSSNRHRLIPLPAEAAVVRYMAGLYLSGLSCRQVARRLSQEGIPTPTQSKQRRGQDLGRAAAGQWGAGTVRKILTNRVYLGHMVQGREQKLSFKEKKTIAVPPAEWIVVENTHQPILSEAVFENVQQRMQRRSQPDAKRR